MKNCPFCGAPLEESEYNVSMDVDCKESFVRCTNCKAQGPAYQHKDYDWDFDEPTRLAREAWNQRAAPRVKLEWKEKTEDVSGVYTLHARAGLLDCLVLPEEQFSWTIYIIDNCVACGECATADEAKLACEQWAQKLAEELCK